MDLNLLQLFVEVARAHGFATAARNLKMQRSTLSRAVASLERELGVQLFTRSTRHVALTSAGQALYDKVTGHLSGLHDALETVPERGEAASGQLRITVPHDMGAQVFPPVIAGFIRRYPKVRVDARITNRVVDLVGEGFDAAIRPGGRRLPDSSLKARRLTEATGGMFASPVYLARAGTPHDESELAEHDWVRGPGRGPPLTMKNAPILETDDVSFVRAALKEGLGVGFIPTFSVLSDLNSGDLVQVLPGAATMDFTVYLVTPPMEHVPRKLRVFRDYLVDFFARHPLA